MALSNLLLLYVCLIEGNVQGSDPMQLGPVVLSREAKLLGLGESYMERLLYRFPYLRDKDGFPETNGYDPRLVTRLVYNYRSLPGILHIPNELFYHGELRPTICPETSEEVKFLKTFKEILPQSSNGSVPCLVFHALRGFNYQAEDSPSWYNPDEAGLVFFYLNELYRLGAKSEDIGIISPYVRQVKQIRELIIEAEFDMPKVGSVEEFQGQEFNIIIISTVRSNSEYLALDARQNIGFISSTRRLNVAMTRAQCLNIIIGNPDLLVQDSCWKNILIYCKSKNVYIGTDCMGLCG